MTLAELYAACQQASVHSGSTPENISVVITLAEPSLGGRAFSPVKSVYIGFDWESNQFRIEPTVNLVKQGHAFSDVMPAKKRISYDNTRQMFVCTTCDCHVSQNDKFCSNCGQKLK